MIRRILLVLPFVFAAMPLRAAEVVMTVEPAQVRKTIPPGAVGWGAMWKQKMLYPAPGQVRTDGDHKVYIDRLAKTLAPIVARADLRNISWPWGVSFSTWGVNWENSAKPWSRRPADCARIPIINRGSGWCEKAIVGVGDLMYLAKHWRLEALTVAVPLSVLDRSRVRWGPHFITHAIDDATIEKISDHAVGLIAYMKSRPEWNAIARIYLEAGTEWRHYGQPRAVATYAKLIKRIRAKITDRKVIIVASASDSADLQAFKANSWNKPLHEALRGTRGVAFDLHRYRGMVGLEADAKGNTAATVANVRRLARTGVTQRGYFTVHPRQWGQKGSAMPSVLLENAIHGRVGDHSTRSGAPWPWPAVVAHADLVREALASPAMTFLGWTWFPEDLPKEWPHGALLRNGRLAKHAQAQAFLSRYHRGKLLRSTLSDDRAIRGNAVRGPDGRLYLYGGNFSLEQHRLRLAGAGTGRAKVDYMTGKKTHTVTWDPRTPLTLPPMTLWRAAFIR